MLDPDILDKNPINKLADDQRMALRKLLAIRRTSKSFAKGPTRDKYVAKTKKISWNVLNPDSEFNREVNDTISEAKHDVDFARDIRDRLTALKTSPHKNEFIRNMEKRLTELKKPISKTPRRGGRKGGRRTHKRRSCNINTIWLIILTYVYFHCYYDVIIILSHTSEQTIHTKYIQ